MAKPADGGRDLLKDRAYDRIQALILKGELTPGTILSKRELARQLGISKTPVDAALERLRAEGFVTITPRHGVVVRQFTVKEITDLFDLRLAVEPFVARRLAARLAGDQADALARALKAQARAVKQGDVAASAQLDTEYHLMLCEFLGNGEILRVMRQLRWKLQGTILEVFRQLPGRLASNHVEHSAIAESIVGQNGERAAERMADHLASGRRYLVAY